MNPAPCSLLPAPCPPRETDVWHAAYGAEAEIRRRRGALPAKLRRLGIDAAPRDAAILDLCCGHGETLDSLHALGFSRLDGLDLRIDDRLARDRRFRTLAGDALSPTYADRSFDWVLNIHSLHHFASADRVAQFLEQSWRVLKPGGRLGIVDFPASPQIRMAFWFFRQNRFLWTPYLQSFGRMIQEEWSFLKDYLPQWPEVRRLLLHGRFQVERRQRGLFYFYLTLRKPL
jgi:ubiquinone/menaquinone biosynthesis C-methylase UbiE